MGRTVRSLAVEAGVTVRECSRRLRQAGIEIAVGGQRVDGRELAVARKVLGLTHRSSRKAERASQQLDREAMIIRLLRPLREKGKLGREHTTAIEHVYGHGVPDHLKAEAKELVEELIRSGSLAEKVSQGRRHLWLTSEGQARLLEAAPEETGGSNE